MENGRLIVPKDYSSPLDLIQTQKAIKVVKDNFEKALAKELKLTRVSAPMFVFATSGLNDDLTGVERPVQFDAVEFSEEVQIVHSLAKWKRLALKRYGFKHGKGLYTDMNAIRRDEDLDNTHSIYVDQWDWEKVISKEERTIDYLKSTVKHIVRAMEITQYILHQDFPQLKEVVDGNVTFVTSQELEDMYPDMTPQQRENAIAKKHKTVFIIQIGHKLKSGAPHGHRAPDYDDWCLNGDLIVWDEQLGGALELSSMGIRVDENSLNEQLRLSDCEYRKEFDYHKLLLNGELPLTVGGGVGQSRLCMYLLHKAHIGEVQASVWPQKMIDECQRNGIFLL